MERPNIKNFFSENTTPQMVNNLFLEQPELYNYIQALDNYIDYLSSQLEPLKKNAEGLLPCPFCKSEPQIASLGGDKENWIVLCPNCQRASVEMGINGAETKEDCIAMWNERA